jgi:type IV secretion system protein VirB4
LRYRHAQVFLFDKGYSSYVLCRAVGGAHYDLGDPCQQLAFCPLGRIDEPQQFAHAYEWLLFIFSLQGMALTPDQRAECQHALLRLQGQPSRTLTDLQSTLQDRALKAAIEYYTLSGPMGEILDATTDALQTNHFQVFEMTHLLEMNSLSVLPVLFYLFSQIESRLNGAPTLIIIEEGHRFLTGKFGERLEQWLRELRKKNAAVLFLTQHLTEIFQSPIKHILLNSCKTKLFLPNHQASDPVNHSLYSEAGLTATQIQLIKHATPKKHYYYTSPLGSRMLDLNIGPLALSFLGVDSQADRRDVDALIERYPNRWQQEWLHQRGLSPWAHQLDDRQSKEERKCDN